MRAVNGHRTADPAAVAGPVLLLRYRSGITGEATRSDLQGG
jgi:hypothetical protein